MAMIPNRWWEDELFLEDTTADCIFLMSKVRSSSKSDVERQQGVFDQGYCMVV